MDLPHSKSKRLLIAGLVILPLLVLLLLVIVSGSHIRVIRNTVYSEKFSQAGFDSVAPGASVEQVKSILGEPLKIFKHDDGSMFYVYSRAKKMDIDFYSKQVIFQDGKVVGKFSSLYYELLY